MRRTLTVGLMSLAMFGVMGGWLFPSEAAGRGRLLTRVAAKAFFDEYFAQVDRGKVPREGPGTIWRIETDALGYVYEALKDKRRQLMAIRLLGHAETDDNVLPHLYPFLKHKNQPIRAAAVIALGRRRKSEATPHLIPLLKDPDNAVVRVTVDSIGNCGGKGAARALIDLYRNGETHDWWGYHIKAEIMISLCELKAREALPLAYEALGHKSVTVFRFSVILITTVSNTPAERTAAGQQLLSFALADENPKKISHLVRGLGKLRYAPAIGYIRLVYHDRSIPKLTCGDHAVAVALADIATPKCAEALMDIYLTTNPLSERTCTHGAPIVPCLRGLRALSGKDFGDDRKKWKAWYKTFARQHGLKPVPAKPTAPADAGKRQRGGRPEK